MTGNQIWWLTLAEFRRVIRTKGYLIQFLVLPLLVWLAIFAFNYQSTGDNYAGLPLSVYDGDSTQQEDGLGDLLIRQLTQLTRTKGHPLYGVELRYLDPVEIPLGMLQGFARNQRLSPLLRIPANFSTTVQNPDLGSATVELLTLPENSQFNEAVMLAVKGLILHYPFSDVTVLRSVAIGQLHVESTTQDNAVQRYVTGFFSSYIAVLIPAFYVSNAFTAEREEDTIESLLSLPLTAGQVMRSKIGTGMLLSLGYSLFSTLGLVLNGLATTSGWGKTRGLAPVHIDVLAVVGHFVVIWLVMSISLAAGLILVASYSDKRVSLQIYMMVIVVPSAVFPLMVDIFEADSRFSLLHLVPWSHPYSVMNKLLYPGTYTNRTLTGSMGLDLVYHASVLLVMLATCLLVASWRSLHWREFDR